MDKQFIVDNLGYRLGIYYPNAEIQIGTGNPNAKVLVVQSTSKMPDRDATTGALKKFGMLDVAYRATTNIVNWGLEGVVSQPSLPHGVRTQEQANRYYLKELIQIIKPLVIVACGPDVVALLKRTKSSSTSGRKFRVSDMPEYVFYATINPADYGFARASQHLKDKGKEEWSQLETILKTLREKEESERWV